MTLRALHRTLAFVLAAFIVLHLLNHLMLFAGTDSHIAMMDTLRLIYRNPVVEPALFAGFTLQIGIGARMIWRRGRPRHFWGWMQAGSGIIVALFLIQHMSAVIMTRWTYPQMSTDIFWAASVVSRPTLAAYFAPYYALGIAGIFIHIAAVFAQRRQHAKAYALTSLGSAIGIAIVGAMMGAFHPIALPEMNEIYLDTFWGDPE